MYSSYEIEGYVFDTVALQDALDEVEYERTPDAEKYTLWANSNHKISAVIRRLRADDEPKLTAKEVGDIVREISDYIKQRDLKPEYEVWRNLKTYRRSGRACRRPGFRLFDE